MLNPSNTQGIYLNVPMTDWALLKELIRKFGWQAETREQLLNRFVKSRSNKELLSDEEIMEEVNAVRYGKWKYLYLLSLADSIGAVYIVSGDADLLDLKYHNQTKMLKLADFKKLLEN